MPFVQWINSTGDGLDTLRMWCISTLIEEADYKQSSCDIRQRATSRRAMLAAVGCGLRVKLVFEHEAVPPDSELTVSRIEPLATQSHRPVDLLSTVLWPRRHQFHRRCLLVSAGDIFATSTIAQCCVHQRLLCCHCSFPMLASPSSTRLLPPCASAASTLLVQPTTSTIASSAISGSDLLSPSKTNRSKLSRSSIQLTHLTPTASGCENCAATATAHQLADHSSSRLSLCFCLRSLSPAVSARVRVACRIRRPPDSNPR